MNLNIRQLRNGIWRGAVNLSRQELAIPLYMDPVEVIVCMGGRVPDPALTFLRTYACRCFRL